MLVELILLILAVLSFLYALSIFGPVALIINSVIALVALKVLSWLGIRIRINIWTILIIVFWGLIGLLVLMFLALTGLAFRER